MITDYWSARFRQECRMSTLRVQEMVNGWMVERGIRKQAADRNRKLLIATLRWDFQSSL